ncbi:DUF305 domain-containing protein [Streptomyces sp. NPDC049881]|uniref:DUF305 domain-containing protein n=1 Tax=Streptomyces sp. NPDC049881 TaxID=3155778 RepID=UPI003435D570
MTAHRPQARRAAPLRCVLTAVLAALLAVTACSGADRDTADAAPRDAPGPVDPGSTEHNAADVAFVRAMVARHREAVALAEAAAPRAESAAVRALAERIAASQGPDVATMTGWLDDWGEDAPATDDDGDGALSDRAFLTGMIDRHRDAVDLAGAELAEGVHRPARELARAVVTTRTAEIGEMTALLAGD